MSKSKYYILNLTWGLPMNIIGGIVALVLLCMGYKPKKFGTCIYFVVGKWWGGLNLGMFFITDAVQDEHTLKHEFGHSVQNAMYGVLFPFIVAIPSAVRYWVREYQSKRGKWLEPYDAIWFEGQATALGNKYIQLWRK